MTVVLVLFTLTAFLAADFFVQRSRAAREREAALQVVPILAEVPPDIGIANNHTWTKKEGAGAFLIGIDEFLGKMTGVAEQILLPEEGSAVGPWDPAITIGADARQLSLAAPLAGRVVSVNRAVLKNPALARTDPYRAGWLIKVEADSRRDPVVHTRAGSAATLWLKTQLDLAREFFAGMPRHGGLATAQDGGAMVEGALRLHGGEVWKEFAAHFAALPERRGQATSDQPKR